ncbi:MAG: cytochrome c peroxidase [Deltaproteobacteria bacterium]|nr:cytochrome c peroxidase [Deltaproteobacteria bacterium]
MKQRRILGSLGGALLVLTLRCSPPAPTPTDASMDSEPQGDAVVIPTETSTVDSGRSPFCGANGQPTVAYPPGPYEVFDDAILPNLSLSDGSAVPVQLAQYFNPCAQRSKLLVIRAMASWSGPSRWHAENTARAVRALGDRAEVLDLLVLGQENLPANARDLASWRARYPQPLTHRVVLEPEYLFRTLYLGIRQLPVILVVDTRTMRAVRVLTGPNLHEVDENLARAIAIVDGQPMPRSMPLGEHELAEDQMDMVRAMARIPAPPPSLGNHYADDPRAAAMGERLFRDTALSSGGVSCASCHDPARDFTDGRATGQGVRGLRGGRNTPTVRFAGYTQWLFWDGRADSAWSQAIGPIENPIEMEGTRLQAAHVLYDRYRTEYEAVFGAMPALADNVRFPLQGKPGDAAFDGMAPADQIAIHRVYANLGKSLEAYERTLRFAPSAFDRFVMGDRTALTAAQQVGMHHFFSTGCIQCHHGPMMTDDSFHNITIPTGRADGMADVGRYDAIAQVMGSLFNAGGMFSDDPVGARAHLDGLTAVPLQRGMIHTPGLRGVARTGPWGHGGTFVRLEDLMKHYGSDLLRNMVPRREGVEDIHLGNFHTDDQTINELTQFVRAL